MAAFDELLEKVPANTTVPMTVWQDRPPAAPPDAAPPTASAKIAYGEGASSANVTAAMQARLNRLYDALPENVRSSIQIVETPRTETPSREALQRAAETGAHKIALAPPPLAQPGLLGMAQTPQSALVAQGAGFVKIAGDLDAARKVARQSGLAISDEGIVTVVPEGEKVGASRSQFDTAPATARAKTGNDEAYEKLLASVPVAGSAESRQAGVPSFWVEPGVEPFSRSITQRLRDIGATLGDDALTGAAVTAGVLKGVVNVPLGVMQAAQTPEALMRPLQDMYQGLSDQFEELTGKRPVADFAGRLMGSTAAILYGARALGPVMALIMPRAVTGAWELLGAGGRTLATGAGVGATQFYEKGAEGEGRFGLEKFVHPRVIDAMGGGVFGALGGIIAKGVNFAMTRLAQSGQAEKFLPELEKTAAGIVRNTEKPLDDTLTHYARVERTASNKYGMRNAAGQQFEGFPAGVGAGEISAVEEGFAQAIEKAVAASPARGIANRPGTTSLASRVENILGLDKEKGRLAEWQAQMREYEEAVAKLPKGYEIAGPTYLAQLARQGKLPQAPAPFVPEPVTPEAYAAARTAINASLRGRGDAATKTQAKMLLGAIDEVAETAAASYGMNEREFLRRATAANKFYQENVAPLRQLFGGKTATEAKGRQNVPFEGTTPAEFFDKIVRMVDKNDVVLARDLGKVLGPQGKDNLKMMVAARALEMVDDPKNVSGAVKYIRDHEPVLRELLGRDEYTQLLGLGKIAQSVMKQAFTAEGEARRSFNPWARSLAPMLATYNLFQGQFLHAAGTMAALPAYHAAMRVLNNIHQGRAATPLIRKAASMDPESKEFVDFMRVIERKVRAGTAAAANVTQP